MTEQFSILVDEFTINCRIRRSRKAKHIRLTMRHDSTLSITIPYRARNVNIDALLVKHRQWIRTQFQKIQERHDIAPPYEIADGALLPVLDKEYILNLHNSKQGQPHWIFEDSTLHVHIPDFAPEWLTPALIGWYRHMAGEFLKTRVPYWAKKMNVFPGVVRVKNQHTLWGSCSRKGSLNFNWRILLLTPEAADYLIVHELAHLCELNHSKNFWTLVAQYSPDFKILKTELKRKNSWLTFP